MTKIYNRDVIVKKNVIVTERYKDAEGAVAVPELLATSTVVAKTANATITVAEFGKIITNAGAGGAITLTLPAASATKGKSIQIAALAAQVINVDPIATNAIFLAGSGVANKDLVIAGVIGNRVTIYSNGTSYEAYFLSVRRRSWRRRRRLS